MGPWNIIIICDFPALSLQRFIYDFRLLRGNCEPEEADGGTLGMGVGVSFRQPQALASVTGPRPPSELEQLQRAGDDRQNPV